MNRSRQAFTLVEVMVAMALTMFVMVILSQAFVAGLDTFSGLKAIGDMGQDMRTAGTLLKSDLAMDHLEGKRRLSDRALNSVLGGNPNPDFEPLSQGFFRIVQLSPSTLEGYDQYGLPSYYAGDQHYLHFAVKQRGNQREKFFSTQIPGNSQLASGKSATLLRAPGVEGNASMKESGGVFNSPWAEVVWFLAPQGSTIAKNDPTSPGSPLYGLYRAQFVAAADTRDLPPLLASSGFATAASQPGVACIDDPVSGNTIYWNPNDMTNPGQRTFNLGNRQRAATLVLKNVLTFNVRILQTASPGDNFVDPPGGVYDTGNPTPTSIQAVQIIIRTWDDKTQQTRQITIIQDL